MRSPGFEPGLSGWEPDVLTKLDYNRTETSVFRWTKINKLVPQTSNNQKIHNLLIALESSGLDEDTVTCIGYKLTDINEETDINNTTQVALFIARLKRKDKDGHRTGKSLSPATKTKYVNAYTHYAEKYGLKWQTENGKKPKYRVPENTPLIPTQKDVQAIIDNSSKNYVVIFTIESEIGCCPEELHLVTRKMINMETGEIYIKGVKRHGSSTYHLKRQTLDLLQNYLNKHPEENPFPTAHTQSQMFLEYKQRAFEKLRRPEILAIQLRNLRNYAGDRFYKSLPIRDAFETQKFFRHAKLDTTGHYLRAIKLEYEDDGQWLSLITNSPEEEAKATENNWQFIRAFQDTTKALYRKRKI